MTEDDLRPDGEVLRSDLTLFAVATPSNQARFDLRPFGMQPAVVFDPLLRGTAPFLRLLSELDAATFGPEGMPMPRWIFYNGAELPGGIVGLGAYRGSFVDQARSLMPSAGGATGLIPLSMYIAIPTVEHGTWVGHNLASLAGRMDEPRLRGLASVTKALGLRVFRARSQVGVTQWASPALRLHIRLGPLALETAWTPAHSEPRSLTYRAKIDTSSLRHLAHDPRGEVASPAEDRFIDCEDEAAMRELQEGIERGERWEIVRRPEVTGAREQRQQRIPVRRID
jgi:hypothetical protein